MSPLVLACDVLQAVAVSKLPLHALEPQCIRQLLQVTLAASRAAQALLFAAWRGFLLRSRTLVLWQPAAHALHDLWEAQGPQVSCR